ncbi:MAG: aminotransferase class I/II-fold pyridoxal phosphate-dependent enzyme [Planctomycetota bacterium]
MPAYPDRDAADLRDEMASLEERLEAFRTRKLALDMTRGKPCPAQLDLANGMLTCLGEDDYRAADGADCRNYGGLDGLPEARTLLAEMIGVAPEAVLLGNNSSLALMHDAVLRALVFGVPGGDGPWNRGPVKFVCPAPGYDRHFAICEHFGIEMIPVAMTDDGPDVDAIEQIAGADAAVKGLWCVPKYANPTGATCSDATVDRLAGLRTAAPDFRIFWDNAYAVHHLGDGPAPLKDILAACAAAGRPDRPLVFGSTSKVTFAGGGIGCLAASPANLDDARGHLKFRTIGPDKLNQLRHARFFGSIDGLLEHMRGHAAILKPKFDAVQAILARELDDCGVATWSRPTGGYFVNLDVLDGCAKEVGRLAGEAGVKLTQPGATYPYGKDPRDRNIRIAPTLPSLEEITTAMELVCVCVRLAAARKLAGAA